MHLISFLCVLCFVVINRKSMRKSFVFTVYLSLDHNHWISLDELISRIELNKWLLVESQVNKTKSINLLMITHRLFDVRWIMYVCSSFFSAFRLRRKEQKKCETLRSTAACSHWFVWFSFSTAKNRCDWRRASVFLFSSSISVTFWDLQTNWPFICCVYQFCSTSMKQLSITQLSFCPMVDCSNVSRCIEKE